MGNGHVLHPCRFPVLVIVVEIGRKREGHLVEHAQVRGIRHPGAMSSLVPDDQAEGLVPFALVQPVFSRVLDYVRYVTVRSEEHTSELQSLMRISYAVFCLKKKKCTTNTQSH